MKEELKKNIMLFFAGGAVGAGAALLLAPKPGKEIRRDLKRFAGTTKDRVVLAVDKGKVLYDEGIAAVESVIDAGKTALVREKDKWLHA
jgi:gas vesicle protein